MRTLAFYNIKGGVGKTTAAVNIAYLCAAEGNRTLLWDLDPQGAACFYYRRKARLKRSPEKLIRNRKKLTESIRGTDFENLDVLPADFANRHLDVILSQVKRSRRRLSRLSKALRSSYDYLILDCPPSISLLSENVFRAADVLLVPVVPSPLSMRSMEQIHAYFRRSGLDPSRIIPFFSMADLRKSLHRQLIADPPLWNTSCKVYIPYLSAIEQMAVSRAPLPATRPNSRGSRAFVALWSELKTRVTAFKD